MKKLLSETKPFFPLPEEGNEFLAVHYEDWELADGQRQRRFKYTTGETGDTALVVAFTPELKMIAIREFQPIQNSILSCIGCGVKKDEHPIAAANRGLLEKTGYKPHRVELMATFVKDVGYTNGHLLLFLATGCYIVATPPKECVVLIDPHAFAKNFLGTVMANPTHAYDGTFTLQGLAIASSKLGLGLF